MPVKYQKFITRQDLRANPDTLYVFGDNLDRSGYGGQAKFMRGEPNAVGIVTKLKPTMHEYSFLEDLFFEDFLIWLDKDEERIVDHLKKGMDVVIPTDGIGTGLAQLPERAPEIYKYIIDMFKRWESIPLDK